MNIRIDNEPYTIADHPNPCSNGQQALLDILKVLASLSDNPNVRGVVLQELLGLRIRQPYEFRLKRLIDKGCLIPREVAIARLETMMIA